MVDEGDEIKNIGNISGKVYDGDEIDSFFGNRQQSMRAGQKKPTCFSGNARAHLKQKKTLVA